MLSKIKKFFKSIGKCCRPNCQNPAAVFGICEEHIREEWEGVDEQIEDEEHQKLVKAFKQAIRETEEEKKAVKCFFGPL